MTLDPYSATLLTAAGGAVAGEFVKKAWNSGERWLNNYFQEHQPEAQEKAKENALDFLVDLGNRIQKLENIAEDDYILKDRLESSLADPDFSAILKDAILFSSRTSSEEKHNLIARVVSERLLSDSDSLESSIGSMSIEAIFHLSSIHLRLLALRCFIDNMEPTQVPLNLSDEDYNNWWMEWFINNIKHLIPNKKVHYMDYLHLESVSCATIVQLKSSLDIRVSNNSEFRLSNNLDNLKENDVGKELLSLWDEGLWSIRLNSIGYVIGLYVFDEVFGDEIDFTFRNQNEK
jgi:hypothetical protein